MADEQQPSPEEKLLKVIQAPEGQKQKPAEPARPQPSAAPAPSPEPSPKPAPARKLKPQPEAAQSSPAAPSPAQAGAMAAAQPPQAARAATESAQPPDAAKPAGASVFGATGDGSWLRHANHVLGVITFLMVLLVAYECWSNIAAVRERNKSGPQPPRPLPAAAAPELPPIDGLIARFEKGVVIQHPEDGVGSAGRTNEAGRVPLTGWRDYAQRNLDLIGMASSGDSGSREAIVVDRQQKQMHVVRPGDKIMVEGRQVEVVSVGEDDVSLTDGSVKLTIR